MEPDALAMDELRPMGGSWSGLLFDNPALWLAPAFTWTFTFRYADVARDYGRTSPALSIDWVPLPGSHWQDMAGRRASCQTFAEPIESSIYFFEHHRYDQTSLQVAKQRTRSLHVAAEVYGDLDGLGIEALGVSSWLLFDGITVALSDGPRSVDDARAVLNDFTDTTGLEGFERYDGFWFAPRD